MDTEAEDEMKIGIDYHPEGGVAGEYLGPTEAARRTEEVGLDGFWIADNLVREDKPILECLLCLAAAGAVTERVDIAVGVIQLPMRKTAWLAKEAATLQVLTGNRFILGVGVGGTFPDEWATIDAPHGRRGAHTDAMLDALPSLLAGEPTQVPDGSVKATLLPAVPMPPIWVGGSSAPALRRAARYGDGWLPAKMLPDELRTTAQRVAELAEAAGRPAPATGVQLHGDLSAARGSERHRELTTWVHQRFKLSVEEAERYVLVGSPQEVAERLAGYQEVGVEQAVIAPQGPNWLKQCDVLGEARQLLGA